MILPAQAYSIRKRLCLFPATSLEKDVAYFFPPLSGLVSQQRLLKRTLRIFFSSCMISRPAARRRLVFFTSGSNHKSQQAFLFLFPSNVFLLNRFRRCVVSLPAATKRNVLFERRFWEGNKVYKILAYYINHIGIK